MSKIAIQLLALKDIKKNPKNPNKMDDETYNGMVESMKRQGWLLDPPVVRELDDGTFRAISGHHRIRAGVDAGIIETYCKVLSGIDGATEDMLLVEANKRRGKLSTQLLSELIDDIMMTHDVEFEEIIENTGLDQQDMIELGYGDFEVEIGDLIIEKQENKFVDFKFGEIKGTIDIDVYNDFVKIISTFDKYKLLNEKIKEIINRWQKTENHI